jgi:hypothetical protein
VAAAKATVARDEGAQTTTYEVGIPWSVFGVLPGLSPRLKVAFHINDTDGALGKQKRLSWGEGVGGRFVPWKFKVLAVGDPPAGTRLASLTAVTRATSGGDGAIEALAAICGEAGTVSARYGDLVQATPVAGDGKLHRYSVRARRGDRRASSTFAAALVRADGRREPEVSFRVFDDSTDGWYAFAPASDRGPSVIGMEDWMDAPAGKHGFMQAKGKDLVFADGTPAKLWGVGTRPYAGGLAPDKATATAFAEWYRKWGVNSVRNGILFGTEWRGLGDPNDTTKLDLAQLDRFDFAFAELKKNGVYYDIVAFWTETLRAADRAKVLAFDEAKGHASELDTFAEDIQDLRIAAVVNFLNHRNPYTGLTYAEDAALSCIEIRNEQDVYWYTVQPGVAACPTYAAKIRKDFCAWLKARYGSQQGLVAAWGQRCIGTMWNCSKDESLDAGTLSPMFNAWFFSPTGLADQEAHLGARRRLLDTAEFLYETQKRYYERFAAALRATGYQGVIVGSNWQADSGVSHLWNLLSDRAVGRIDRHNYFGGAAASGMNVGTQQDNSSMLWQPGRGLMSTGLQQVADRPFALTEWMAQAPNEWLAEGPPLIGFYGFGLQGWDAAYHGNDTEPRFDPTFGTWLHVQDPLDLGLYPAIARSVYRGDVTEGPVIASRRVCAQDLRAGRASDVVEQQGDVKTVRASVPAEALAAGRVVLDVADEPGASVLPDLDAQLKAREVDSATGQLKWRYGSRDESFFTVDTAGTKAVVGFAPDREFALGEVKLRVDNRFAVLVVTALDRGKTLRDTHSALITAVARARNTGMAYNGDHSLAAVGGPPILLEPVRGSVSFDRKFSRVLLLDHDGRRTDRQAHADGATVTIDGAADRTLYYEVQFE